MFNMYLENKDGKTLQFGASTPYTITEFSGLNPPKATINTSTTATLDGGMFNSAKLQMRTINLAFAIEENAEQNRLAVYEVVQPKNPIRLYYQSEMLDVFLDGYVEEVVPDYFAKKQIVTVSILCPFPYFKSAQQVINELSSVIKKFHFPFASTADGELIFGEVDTLTSVTVLNQGSVKAGLTFELYAKNPITNPKIFNYQTSEFLAINTTMQQGDLITVTTGQGNKTITLLRDGVTTNIFNLLDKNSTWLQLDVGGGVFVYEVEEGSTVNLSVTISHYDLFEGV